MIKIKIATTKKLRSHAYGLRHRVYVLQDKKFTNVYFPGNEIKNEFDDQENTVTLVAMENSLPIGTISYYVFSPLGLPIQDTIKHIYDLNSLLESREFNAPLYSCGMLAVDEKHRRNAGLVLWLYKFLFQIAAKNGARDVIATNNYLIEPMLSRFGLTHLIPMSWYSEEIDNFINLMYGKLDEISARFEMEAIPKWHSIFEKSNEIWISKRESFIREGKGGNKIFLLTEGVVDITTKTKNTDFLLSKLYPGDSFGEMAIFPDGLRTATVTPNSLGVTRVLNRKAFVEILRNANKTYALFQILIDRIKEMNLRVHSDFKNECPIKSSVFPQSVMDTLSEKQVKAGDIICSEGETGRHAYLIMEGEALIEVNDKRFQPVSIGTLTRGASFGYMAFISNTLRTTSVIAKTDCVLKTFTREDFQKIIADPEVGKNILRDLLEILEHMNKGLSADSKRDNMLSGFKRLIMDYFIKEPLRHHFDDLPFLSAHWVADEMGIDQNIAQNLLSQLLKKGILQKDAQTYTLIDGNLLKKFKFKLGFER